MSTQVLNSLSPVNVQLDPDELERLQRVFHQYPEIQAVYVFGSTARGNRHGESDLDLGVVPRSGADKLSKLDLLTDLARVGFDNVDIVILDVDNILLKYEAVRYNALLYQTPDFDSGAYFSRIIRQYLDFLPYLTTQRRAYKESALYGQT